MEGNTMPTCQFVYFGEKSIKHNVSLALGPLNAKVRAAHRPKVIERGEFDPALRPHHAITAP